jgi:hypothetical protein
MKKLISVLGVGAAVAATVLGGVTTASAATQSTPARCAGYGNAWTNADLLVRAGAGANYRSLGSLPANSLVSCFPVVVGNKYQACGFVNANGWIPIDLSGDARIDGYLPSTCLTDA